MKRLGIMALFIFLSANMAWAEDVVITADQDLTIDGNNISTPGSLTITTGNGSSLPISPSLNQGPGPVIVVSGGEPVLQNIGSLNINQATSQAQQEVATATAVIDTQHEVATAMASANVSNHVSSVISIDSRVLNQTANQEATSSVRGLDGSIELR